MNSYSDSETMVVAYTNCLYHRRGTPDACIALP